MDIQQPPLGADLKSSEMQRFLQDAYNGLKCPFFDIYYNQGGGSHWTLPGPNTYDLVPFNTIVADPFGGWDPVNYRWTPKVPGYYSINATGTIYANFAPTLGTIVRWVITKNGTIAAGTLLVWPNLTGYGNCGHMVAATTIQYLNGQSDFIDVRTQKTSASSHYLLGGEPAQFPHFSAHKLQY